MPSITPIGGGSGAPATPATQQNTIDQNDFIKLFLSQLQFQDPLEPVDNREFLAQMAQFSALEQARQTSANTENQLILQSSTIAMGLLDQLVVVDGQTSLGRVTAVTFSRTGPELDVMIGGQLHRGVRMADVTRMLPASASSPPPASTEQP
jgi:flagellar basal-body rod modification protein FlgD